MSTTFVTINNREEMWEAFIEDEATFIQDAQAKGTSSHVVTIFRTLRKHKMSRDAKISDVATKVIERYIPKSIPNEDDRIRQFHLKGLIGKIKPEHWLSVLEIAKAENLYSGRHVHLHFGKMCTGHFIDSIEDGSANMIPREWIEPSMLSLYDENNLNAIYVSELFAQESEPQESPVEPLDGDLKGLILSSIESLQSRVHEITSELETLYSILAETSDD